MSKKFVDTIYENKIKEFTNEINEVLFEKIPVGKKLKTMEGIGFTAINVIPANDNAMNTIHEMVNKVYEDIVNFYDENDVDVRHFEGINVKTVAVGKYVKTFLFFKKTEFNYLVQVNADLLIKPSREYLEMVKEYKKVIIKESK